MRFLATSIDIGVTVNGTRHEARIESRMLLSDFLRNELRLTGTHVGCEHGVCGACTLLVNGEAVRSCTMLAVQARGATIVTIEGAADNDPQRFLLLRQAFTECHALQCGYCTPGFLISAYAFLRDYTDLASLTDEEIRKGLSGNLCRCTGYQNIVRAVRRAACALRGSTVPS